MFTVLQRTSVPLALAASTLAWILLWQWREVAGDLADVPDWTRSSFAASLCFPTGNGSALDQALVFGLGWLVMVVAMMGPIAFPALAERMGQLTTLPRTAGAVFTAVAGYLLVWLAAGMLMHGGAVLLAELIENSALLTFNGWLIGVLIFAVAGAYQLTVAKARALDSCRECWSDTSVSPSGTNRQNPLHVGLSAGWKCVKCGWTLMLLMFVFFPGDLLWMTAIAVMMMLDRIEIAGHGWSKPLGSSLVFAAILITLANMSAIF